MNKLLIMALTVAVAWGAMVLIAGRLLDRGGGAASADALPSAPRPDDTPPTQALRDQLLRTTWQEIGVAPREGTWGALMEIGFAKGVATVVGLADGTASLYLTSGGGVLGAGARPEVRKAAVQLCETAARFADGTTATSTFPRPHAGQVRFYLLMDAGVRTVETDEDSLRAGKHRLSPLYAAGQNVITALREATGASRRP
jgi:hypothetical protein